MHTAELCLVAAALFIAGIAKGATGVGMPVIGVPLLATILQVRRAISLITIPLVVTNIAQALEGGELSKYSQRLLFPVLGFIPGCFFGFKILFGVDAHLSNAIGGAMLITAAAVSFSSRKGVQFWSKRYTHSVGLISGTLAGVLAGLSGVSGPPVFVYLLGFGLKPAEFTKCVAIFLIASNGIMALILINSHHMQWPDIFDSVVATAPVFLGMLVGQRVRDRIPVAVFRRVVLAFVVMAGAQLTYRGFFG